MDDPVVVEIGKQIVELNTFTTSERPTTLFPPSPTLNSDPARNFFVTVISTVSIVYGSEIG